MANPIDDVLRFHETALNLRAYRQQLLATNIANADTPGFKGRDIDFRAALREAMSDRPGTAGLTTTSSRHIDTGRESTMAARLLYRLPHQASLDGNTVDMDIERPQFADNALHFEAGLAFVSSQIKTMLAAIQG